MIRTGIGIIDNTANAAKKAAKKLKKNVQVVLDQAKANAAKVEEQTRANAAKVEEQTRANAAIVEEQTRANAAIVEEQTRANAAIISDQIRDNVANSAEAIAANLDKARKDSEAEGERAVKNTQDAVAATLNFIENQVQGMGKTLTDSEKRIREGKLVDAIWHVMTDQIRHTEEGLGEAVMESSLLNNIAAAAAAANLGPGGSAAYAAWYAYKQSNNLEFALKAGLIAWCAAEGLSMVNNMPSKTLEEATKKALASASIAGAAVAASGGTDEQVLIAFQRGALLSAARDKYKNVTKKDLEGKSPDKPAITKLEMRADGTVKVIEGYDLLKNEKGELILDAKGNPQLDTTSFPRNIAHVGVTTHESNPGFFSTAETSPTMQAFAQVPYMNDMAYFHDQWVSLTSMTDLENKATILPAIALVGAGADPSVVQAGTDKAVEERDSEDQD